MKKLLILFSCTVIVFLSFLLNSCESDDPKPEGSWTEAEKQSYDQVINIQNEIGNNLDDWFQSMDSLDAINKAYQAFVNSEKVSLATINSQGITVQYANGMRGGVYLNPKDDESEVGKSRLFSGNSVESDGNLKSLVNQKKMILINPHYFERSHYTDQIYSISRNNLEKVNIDLNTFYKNTEATVDRFTQLSGYGVIQIYSHGCAWPKQENITDVYLLTGETVNEATSAKYWDELKTGNIPVIKVSSSNKYWVSPKFIRENNDFSKDTVLFFGGFCYSFLGAWPDIIDDFADGAYMGYDWSVYTHKNANWSVNSIFNLSDTAAEQPVTLNDWFNKTDVPKSYWNEKDNRTVEIHYAGDGNLKLWGDIKVRLIALSSDGAPVSVPGEAGTAYPFRCEVSLDDESLNYVWDIGDGSSPITSGNEVNITWDEEGQYELKVEVLDEFEIGVYGTASLTVTIGEAETGIMEWITKSNDVDASLVFERVLFDDGTVGPHQLIYNSGAAAEWNVIYNLSGQHLTINKEKSWDDGTDKGSQTRSIIIDFSSDFNNILKLVFNETYSNDDFYYTRSRTANFVIENIPYDHYFGNPGDPSATITYLIEDGGFQNGMKDFSFTFTDYDKREDITDVYSIESIDWTGSTQFYLRFSKKE